MLVKFLRRSGRRPMPFKISGACDYKAGQPDSNRQPQALTGMVAAILQPTLKPSQPWQAASLSPLLPAEIHAKPLFLSVNISMMMSGLSLSV